MDLLTEGDHHPLAQVAILRPAMDRVEQGHAPAAARRPMLLAAEMRQGQGVTLQGGFGQQRGIGERRDPQDYAPAMRQSFRQMLPALQTDGGRPVRVDDSSAGTAGCAPYALPTRRSGFARSPRR